MLHHRRLLILNGILLLAVLGGYWGRSVEATALPGGDFLHKMPLAFRDWKATEVPLSTEDRDSLQPDSVLIRRYRSGSERAELAVIAGHRKQTVHTPAFCMTGGGWETIDEGVRQLPLPEGPVQANWMLMSREATGGKQEQILVSYFFTDGDYSTPSVVRFQWAQLLKRFRRGVPIGALVRVITPIGKVPAAAVQLTDEFARVTIPSILGRLRHARLAN